MWLEWSNLYNKKPNNISSISGRQFLCVGMEDTEAARSGARARRARMALTAFLGAVLAVAMIIAVREPSPKLPTPSLAYLLPPPHRFFATGKCPCIHHSCFPSCLDVALNAP